MRTSNTEYPDRPTTNANRNESYAQTRDSAFRARSVFPHLPCVTAAIQAARLGRETLLLSFNRHVGGMTSGGLTATDVGNKQSIGSIALEFYTRIGRIRDFGNAEAESLFRKMLEEAGVTVLFERPLESVAMRDNRILSITVESGEPIKASMFIDATYEGDLMAAAGVSYRVGREPRNAFHESLAGQRQELSWKDVYQFCRLPISPYVVADDPSSGLLPEISPEKPGAPGEGDYRVQAYNFRMRLQLISRCRDRRVD